MDDCCGTIKEDKLGFNNIYIQAKQWALNQTVGRPEIQKFVGALTGKQAQKGLFITTAKYFYRIYFGDASIAFSDIIYSKLVSRFSGKRR